MDKEIHVHCSYYCWEGQVQYAPKKNHHTVPSLLRTVTIRTVEKYCEESVLDAYRNLHKGGRLRINM